jgi:hypothetical protein
LCDGGYRPLHILQEYFAEKDIEGIFHHQISLQQINEGSASKMLKFIL